METQTHTTEGTGDPRYKYDVKERGQNQTSSWQKSG